MTRRRVVVLEGPDCSGKTTLARALERDHGYSYRHEGPPPADRENVFEYYAGKLSLALMETFAARGVVLDRFALGERVYGPALRGRDRLGPAGWRRMRGVLDEVGALRVLCLPPLDRCLHEWRGARAGRGELVPDAETYIVTYRGFERFRWDRGQLLHDWTRSGSLDLVLAAALGRRGPA